MILKTIKRMFGRGEADGVTCEEALALIYDFMDGELQGADSLSVEEHFEKCTACYPHLKLEQKFRARVRESMSRPCVPPGLRDKVLGILAEERASED